MSLQAQASIGYYLDSAGCLDAGGGRTSTPIQISRYGVEHAGAVREFNQRIKQGGWGEFQLPAMPTESDVWECWLALEDGVVRGGYELKNQEIAFHGELRPASFYFLSLSEGVIDRAYSGVGLKIVAHAMAHVPLLFALGMGGTQRPLPRLLKALGWDLYEVPFLFKMLRPGKVLRNLRSMRSTPVRRFALDAAATTGLGGVGIRLLQAARRAGGRSAKAESVREVGAFAEWADAVWDQCKGSYSMLARRDGGALNQLYPASMKRITRLRIETRDGISGWAVVRDTHLKDHKQFGDLYLGSIVDCLAPETAVPAVVAAATEFLRGRGVDLIVTNQTHRFYRTALQRAGYLEGPSNFVLAVSKPISRLVGPLATSAPNVHMNRGDGDGPVHL